MFLYTPNVEDALLSIDHVLVSIFGEKVRNFKNLDTETADVCAQTFDFLATFSLVKNSSGFFNGEYNLTETFRLLRACFILGSVHWSRIITLLKDRDVFLGFKHSSSGEGLLPEDILDDFQDTLQIDTFAYLQQLESGVPCDEWLDFKAQRIFFTIIATPIGWLRECISPHFKYGDNSYNPVRLFDPLAAKKRLIEPIDYRYKYLEINKFTPVSVLRSEVNKLLDSIEKEQNMHRQDVILEAEAAGCDWPDYLSWDNKKKSNNKTAPKVLLGQALEYMEIYDLWKYHPDASATELDMLRSTSYSEGHKRVKEHLSAAKILVEAALFSNFPPV